MDNSNDRSNVTTTSDSSLNLDNRTNNNSDGNGTPSNSKTIHFVDPLKNLPVDNKELVIYVDLTASKKIRSVIQIDEQSNAIGFVNSGIGNGKTINLIGYRQPNGGVKFMSTDWSYKPNFDKDKIIGKATDFESADVFEGFGVESIDINITAMNPPTVNIKFIDTRGGGLFDQETFNSYSAPINSFKNNTSPYSIFFELPPPLFYLTIKGYYGNPVTLCLYLIKWDGTFNSETGNFEINSQFLGYTFAFLQDIKIGHLIGAGNSDEGKRKLTKVSNIPTNEGLIFPVLTLDDLLLRFQRITVKREEEQKNSQEFEKLKIVNEQINFLKWFKTYVGYPASPNIVNELYGSFVDTGLLKRNTEQLFFRDVGLISKNAKESYTNLFNAVDKNLKTYEDLKKGHPNDFYNQGNITKEDIQLPNPTDLWGRTPYPTIDEALKEVNRLMLINEDYIRLVATTSNFSAATKNNWKIDSGFYVLNLSATRKNVDSKLKSLIKYKKLLEKAVENKINKEITDILGFKPTIKNIIGILCNNIEMFLEMIYDVGVKAEGKNNNGVSTNQYLSTNNNNPRKLSLGDSQTDSTDSDKNIVYPFPKVIDKNYKETYIGNIDGIEKELFPEIDFIELLCTGLVYSIKQVTMFNKSAQELKEIQKTETFPINVRDIGIDPYINLDGLPYELSVPAEPNSKLNREIVSTIIRRAFVAYAMSKYEDPAFSKIAELEGISFYESLVSDTYKNSIKELPNGEILSLAESAEYGIITTSSSNSNNYKFENQLYSESFVIDSLGNCNSGLRQWSYHLNLKEDIVKSLKINEKSPNENTANLSEIKKFTSPLRTEQYIFRFFDYDNDFVNKSYLTLGTFKLDNVKNNIKGDATAGSNFYENYTLEKLLPLDNQNGQIDNTYFTVPPTMVNPRISVPFTKSSIYIDTTNNYGKAYLILSSFFFETDKILDFEIGTDYTKIVRVPWYYLLWLGANAYRKNNGEIITFNNEFNAVPTTKYYYVTQNTSEGITNSILIDYFQSYFETWADSPEFLEVKDKFEELLNTPTLGSDRSKQLIFDLDKLILNEYDILVYDSVWMLQGDSAKDETIPKSYLTNYLNVFLESFRTTFKNKNKNPNNTAAKKEDLEISDNIVIDKDIKSAYYIDIKHIYDNWIAGTGSPDSKYNTYSCCKNIDIQPKNQKLKLFDLFKFVDKFRNSTAGDAIININSFSNLLGKKDNGLYSFISKVLTDSYFMHFNLPIFLEFNKSEEVQGIFEPQLEFDKIRSAPSFLCVYNGPPSSNLASTSNYGDDSFNFIDKPKSVSEKSPKDKSSYLVAFNVNYGSQTQSIFKNVSVSTQESKITGEYITLLSDYVQGTGAAKPLLKDNSIYPLMRNRSYTASIQMMGNMMIQPQMYFQLNNIPFFSGAYMIMNVSHRVGANNMTTTFKGVRQNRSPVTIVTDVTSFLKFQYDQGIGSAETINRKVKDLVTESQNSDTYPVLPSNLIKDYTPTTGTAILRAINPSAVKSETHQGIDVEVPSQTSLIRTVNKAGTIFYNYEPLQGNTNGALVVEHTPDANGDGYWYYTGYFGVKGNATFPIGGAVLPKTTIGTGSIFDVPNMPKKYYYHYEIRRSKEKLLSYNDYKNSTEVRVIDVPHGNLELKLVSMDLHNDSIY